MDFKKISILGCGWFGLPFAKALVKAGYLVEGSTTSINKLSEIANVGAEPFLLDLNSGENLLSTFFDTDVLFICIPPKAKTSNADTYLSKIQKVAEAAKDSVKQVVFISSTGVYQDGCFDVDEHVAPNPDTSAGKVLLSVEQFLTNFSGFNTTIIRFAGLIGPNRNLAKFFAGKTEIASGNAPINLITLDDCIGLCLALLATKKFGGIYHGVTPHHPSRTDFYSRLCEVSNMQKPIFNLELSNWKRINSVLVCQELGYNYKVKNWFEWLNEKPVL